MTAYLYESSEDCMENGDHLTDCDDDGYCNHCGDQGPRPTRKVNVVIAMISRQTATVTVELPADIDDDELREQLSEVYELYDDSEWEDDIFWGVEEGTHTILGDAKPDDETDITLD